jgi:hypothetical protein
MTRTFLALAFAALTAPAFANGVITEFPGTGLIFKEAVDIAIAREDLAIARDRITVHYDYRSDAAATQTATIGFPMPLVPINGDPDDPATWPELEGKDVLNYMQFSASVNGVPVETTLHQFAWHQGKDITAQLAAVGIPAYIAYEEFQELVGKLDGQVVEDLIAQDVITTDDERSHFVPKWDYQTVYEWQQDFAPGATQVDIAYSPLAGYPGDFGDTYETAGGEYCIDDQVLKTVADYREKGIGYEVSTVGYITTTAVYWKGPIGEFNLTIKKDLPLDAESGQVGEATSFCGRPDFTETADAFTWTAKDYVPAKDISVVYYFFYSYE